MIIQKRLAAMNVHQKIKPKKKVKVKIAKKKARVFIFASSSPFTNQSQNPPSHSQRHSSAAENTISTRRQE